MNGTLYQSRNAYYKSIFGAVLAGTEVTFRLTLPEDAGKAWFAVLKDDINGDAQPEYMEMKPAGYDGRQIFELRYRAGEPGLYWYRFEYEGGQGRRTIYLDRKGEGTPVNTGRSWQLTVYKPYRSPPWISGGMIYQIFPDRFYSSGKEKNGVPADRALRDDWGGVPDFAPGDRGRVLGNDYFGGDLKGIMEKLPYLKDLGVTCIYLNPIFEAQSNHRYNTSDYFKVDPVLGGEADFKELCGKAHKMGIRIILDGVFSHVGSDSIYFNKNRRYPGEGAYNSKESPYYSWFKFKDWPDQYSSWWGISTLPEVEENNPGYLRFITGDGGVLQKWLRLGASGYRLDVADELPDNFLEKLRRRVKKENPDALVIGEVWEDASNKISYGGRRRFLLGDQLDSVMNYPFRDGIIDFLRGGEGYHLMECVMQVLENYPKPAVDALMNHIGTHDTERILTVLAGEPAAGRGRDWQAGKRLSSGEREKGKKLLRLAMALQFTLPGVPSLYYGDEAGMEGYRDPFNRGCYPWGREDGELIGYVKHLGKLRGACPAFTGGEFIPVAAGLGYIAYIRKKDKDEILVAVNRWCDPQPVPLPAGWQNAKAALGDAPANGEVVIPAEGVSILGIGRWTGL